MIKLNPKGFGALEALLIVVVICLLGGVGYYVYKSNKDDSRAKQNAQTQNTENNRPKTDPNAGYLVVKEWNVRLKTSATTSDAEYVIDGDHKAYLTTKTYAQTLPTCKADGMTGQIVRGKAGYDYNGAGSKIENYSYDYKDTAGKTVTVKPTMIGDYYYIWVGPQASCAEPTDANVAVINKYQTALADLAYTVEMAK